LKTVLLKGQVSKFAGKKRLAKMITSSKYVDTYEQATIVFTDILSSTVYINDNLAFIGSRKSFRLQEEI
jgi:hypothetical protein